MRKSYSVYGVISTFRDHLARIAILIVRHDQYDVRSSFGRRERVDPEEQDNERRDGVPICARALQVESFRVRTRHP